MSKYTTFPNSADDHNPFQVRYCLRFWNCTLENWWCFCSHSGPLFVWYCTSCDAVVRLNGHQTDHIKLHDNVIV